MKKLISAGVVMATLAACAGTPPNTIVDAGRDAPLKLAPRPDYPGYGSAVGQQKIDWSPSTLAEDFAELMFESEWGAQYTRLLRWRGPVTIALADPELDAYRPEVETLVDMVREAVPGLDLSLSPMRSGSITLRTVPYGEMAAIEPTALCFFVPVDEDFDGFVAAAERGEGRWEDVKRLEAVTIFIPQYAKPRVFRSCIIEEIAQALGPGNDLYRLEDSGFNDDGAHDYLTAFDLLMLRVLYAPEIRDDMSRGEATRAAEAVIRRVSAGRTGTRIRSARRVDEQYNAAMENFLASRGRNADRKAINAALRATRTMSQDDHRRGAALRHSAFLHRDEGNFDKAVADMREAVELFERTLPANSARLARARSDFGFILIDADDYDDAAKYLKMSEAGLAANRIDDELAYTLFQRAIALRLAGRIGEARSVEKQALDWAAYVFGADGETLSRWQKVFKDINETS
ncbi:MAG: DUF2927 domain-containing protein [Pseudomonadota bacterium]